MSHTVVGIFDTDAEARQAKAYLVENGFSNSEVDINSSGVAADDSLDDRITGNTSSYTSGGPANDAINNESNSGSDDDDSIGGFFRNLFGGSDEEDHLVSKHTQAGRRGVIVTVHANSAEQAQAAAETLDNHGAIDINEDKADTAYKAAGSYRAPAAITDTVSPDKIKVIDESLNVGKREVETGGVRLRSRIVEKPVEESIRLKQERVTVNRAPVNRAATEADFANFKEGTIEMTEHAEKAVVAKEAHVVEEISLNKQVLETEETIKDSVRHTEVNVENINPDSKNSTL